MTTPAQDRPLALLALVNALIVVAILATALIGGVAQEPFQLARLPEPMAARLLVNPSGLRTLIGFDNLFIVTYTAFGALLAARLHATDAAVAVGALLLSAFLDAVENHHILAMLYAAEQQLPLSLGETQAQMVATAVKFHANYVALTLFGFGFHRLGGLGRATAWLLWLVYLPLGMAIFVAPAEQLRPLIIARGLFFIATFIAVALLFARPAPAPHRKEQAA